MKNACVLCGAVCALLLVSISQAVEVRHVPQTKLEGKIVKALDEKLNLEASECTLLQLADAITKQLGIPVIVDSEALDAIAVSPDEAMSSNAKGATLRTTLELLESWDVAYLVTRDALVITSLDEADSTLILRTYNVQDLVDSTPAADLDTVAIAALVQDFVFPEFDTRSDQEKVAAEPMAFASPRAVSSMRYVTFSNRYGESESRIGTIQNLLIVKAHEREHAEVCKLLSQLCTGLRPDLDESEEVAAEEVPTP